MAVGTDIDVRSRPQRCLVAAHALITGGSGLIGSWLVHHWQATDLEPVVVRSSTDLLSAGAADALLKRVRPDVLIHLAWISNSTRGYRDSPLNAEWLRLSTELLAGCSGAGIRMFAAGSVVDTERTPRDAYTSAKAGTRAAFEADIARGTVTWLRPFYVFDPERGRPELMRAAIDGALHGHTVELRTPNACHDFVHASDVGRAIAMIVEAHVTGIVDIGSGTQRSVAQLVACAGAAWSTTPDVSAHEPSHADDVADISRLMGLGWRPVVTEEYFSDV